MANSFWYLGSPYSKYWEGREMAFVEITKNAAFLTQLGVTVFAPITMTHPIHNVGNFSADYNWLVNDEPFVHAAKGLIVCMMDGWEKSTGLAWEIAEFEKLNKPIVYMQPMFLVQSQLDILKAD